MMNVKLVIILTVLFSFLSTEFFPADRQMVATIQHRKIEMGEKEFIPDSKLLDVPLLNQMDEPRLVNGCEVTSLAMMLNFYQIKVSKNELAERISKVPLNYPNHLKGNPNFGFVGDMAEGPGLSVYNGPIYDLAKEYVGSENVLNLTNLPFEEVLKKVGSGHPVWVITTVDLEPGVEFREWNTPQGKVKVTLSGHSVVITGYDQQYIYVNDPYGYKNRKIEKQTFIDAWKEMGRQAISIGLSDSISGYPIVFLTIR
jgi:uncharacterized protein YvpB